MTMVRTTSRREFLEQGCRAAAALGLGRQDLAAGTSEVAGEFQRGGMVYRPLGATGLHVSLLGFGSHIDPKYQVRAPWGGRLNPEGQAQRDRRIAQALDLGVNFFDVYAVAGQWEPMARMVKGRRDKVILSLKKELPLPTADIIDDGARLFGYLDLFRFVIYDEGEFQPETLERWDVLRKGKAAGKIRAIGIATHDPAAMLRALRELEGLDFIFFPFNFIHSRVAYSDFLPAAIKSKVGLLGMKPLGSGSITLLDPRRPRKGARPEVSRLSVGVGPGQFRAPLLKEAVEKLLSELDRTPDETLAQAALRFVFSRPFLTSALPGMWLEEEVEENYQALRAYASGREIQAGPLSAAAALADLTRQAWLPARYRWLDQKWKTDPPALG